MSNMLVPKPWHGINNNVPEQSIHWLKKLPSNTYCALWQGWDKLDLPQGHDLYVVSFHLEAIDVEWIKQQCKHIKQPIVLLSDSNFYNYPFPDNVFPYTFYYWHHQINQLHNWFGIQPCHKKNYKFSAICNRATQSKVWIVTKLLESARDQSLIILHTWLEEKNVHNWQLVNNQTLDQLTDIFRQQYVGIDISVDQFNNNTMNNQHYTGNPWQSIYQNSALHFTNESFHYSFMNGQIIPGPFITEKTLKCLLGATAFIPTGQFETYKTLAKLGFNFDYFFDTTWDNDSGNISRFESIVKLIDWLNNYSAEELDKRTKDINQYNQNQITSGKFFQTCELLNEQTIQNIIDKCQTIT